MAINKLDLYFTEDVIIITSSVKYKYSHVHKIQVMPSITQLKRGRLSIYSGLYKKNLAAA